MVEHFAGPSELHLKKELSALRKAPFLRDPETCSSWRSPLSSRSIAVLPRFNDGNGSKRNAMVEINSGESLKVPSRRENRRKKVYLYNWKSHSSKSSDSGMRLDEQKRQISVHGGPGDPLPVHGYPDYKNDIYFEDPMTIYGAGGSNPGTPVRRAARLLRRRAISRKQVTKNLPKRSDSPSASLRVLNYLEKSDDMSYGNSENNFHQPKHDLTEKGSYSSRCASPFSATRHGNWSQSSKMFRIARKGDSSHSNTPVSLRSYRRYGHQKPCTIRSKDDSSASVDGDKEGQLDYRGRIGCGIPYQWSKRMRDWNCGGCYSPSLSDSMRRKGSSVLCRRQTLYGKTRSPGSHKGKYQSHYSQHLPLLTNTCHGGGSSEGLTRDETSTYLELELEALSRLNESRWLICRSQGAEKASEEALNRSLSQKYMPRSFDDIVGHDIVVQSLSNSISRGRIAPAYLFQGPRGTGKSSTARIFAAALNCLSAEDKKPCGYCRECTDFGIKNGSAMTEINATNKKDMDKVKYVLKNMSAFKTFSQYRVFVIDECHMLSSKMWSTFMEVLEEPPSHVVFIFITINPDNLPHAIVAHCRKHSFPKIKDTDVVCRLKRLSSDENLDVELEALDLIALNSEGSLRDAEMMLDQLSLLGKRITTSLVNDLVGIVSDEKLLGLLDTAMSSDTAETVKRSRELIDSGIDPVVLMSRLARLIMDVIAGTNQMVHSRHHVTKAELEKLQQALKILSDAERQLRDSNKCSTWFTAALLQLGNGHNVASTHSSRNSSKKNFRTNREGFCNIAKEASACENKPNPLSRLKESSLASIRKVNSRTSNSQEFCSRSMRENLAIEKLPMSNVHVKSLVDATHEVDDTGNRVFQCFSPEKLDEIWVRCIEKCNSKTLKQLLYAHGKLMSITETEGVLTAFIAFGDGSLKSRAEGFLSSITNSIEIVLKHNVEVRIGLIPESNLKAIDSLSDSPPVKQTDMREIMDRFEKEAHLLYGSSDKEPDKEAFKFPRRSAYYSGGIMQKALDKSDSSSVEDEDFQLMFSSEGNRAAWQREETSKEDSVLGMHGSGTGEQSLDAEKGMLQLAMHSKLDNSQLMPEIGAGDLYRKEPSMALSVSSKLWEDDIINEIQELKISDSQSHHSEQVGSRVDHYAISPSLLHHNSFGDNFDKENLDYDSGIGHNGLPCRRTSRHPRGQVRQVNRVGSHKGGCLPCFGHCKKHKATDMWLR